MTFAFCHSNRRIEASKIFSSRKHLPPFVLDPHCSRYNVLCRTQQILRYSWHIGPLKSVFTYCIYESKGVRCLRQSPELHHASVRNALRNNSLKQIIMTGIHLGSRNCQKLVGLGSLTNVKTRLCRKIKNRLFLRPPAFHQFNLQPISILKQVPKEHKSCVK